MDKENNNKYLDDEQVKKNLDFFNNDREKFMQEANELNFDKRKIINNKEEAIIEKKKIEIKKETVTTNNTEEKNKTNSEIEPHTLSKKDKVLIIIAGLLTFLPLDIILSNLISFINQDYILDTYKTTEILSYIPKFIGMIIFIFGIKNNTSSKKIIPVVLILVLIFNINLYFQLENMHGGIDAIGNAIATGFIYNGSLIIYYILSIINFIIYSKTFILKPKTIFLLVIPVIIIVFSPAIYRIYDENSSKLKDDRSFKTINDFKQELIKRNLYVDDGILFGLNKYDEKSQILDFNSNEKKYPAYIYYGYKSKNTNNDYTWIIYYTNGNIYARLSYYDTRNYPKSHNSIGNIFTESNEIYTYNIYSNKYEIFKTNETDKCIRGDIESFERKDEEKIYIDYMYLKNYARNNKLSCANTEKVNYINNTVLDNYAKDFTYEGYER